MTHSFPPRRSAVLLRIEVGYGLEGAVPDLLAGRIIREQITPRFKQGDYAGGIVAGVDSLVALVEGETLPAPPATAANQESGEDSPNVMLLRSEERRVGNECVSTVRARW